MENEIWAQTLVKELIQQKVRTFCIAPGSRSTPLAIAIAEHPLAQKLVHFDERGVGFYALGYAKASGTPVCIVTTSGSAVGNILPAVMEASASHIPLILLTADRPFELRDCGANQTSDQVKIFANFVRYQTDLPPANGGISLDCLRRHIAQAVQKAVYPKPGPVQVNCMLREPFLSDERRLSEDESVAAKLKTHLPSQTVPQEVIDQLALELSHYEKGIIITGELPPTHSIDALTTLSRRLQWPIFPDILSNVRMHGKESSYISYYEQMIDTSSFAEKLAPQAVLHLGGSYVSTPLQKMLALYRPEKYVHVHRYDQRYDPQHLATDRVIADPFEFCSALAAASRGNSSSTYLSAMRAMEESLIEKVESFFDPQETLGEMDIPRFLMEHLSENDALFVGNGMPIRDCDGHFYPKKKSATLFGNRGLSGIDGNIAIAAGICEAQKKRTLALIGDQAFLHDINSLALIKKTLPLQIIVVNNGGSGIFSFLPVREKKEIFETLFAAAHQMNFEAIATQFDIQYFKPQSKEEFEETFLYNIPRNAPAIIEIQTEREQNYQVHKRLLLHLKGYDKKTGVKKLESFRYAERT